MNVNADVYPAVDAYVYADQDCSRCLCVVIICRCELNVGGKTVRYITEVTSFRNREKFPLAINLGEEDFVVFQRNIMLMYIGVQMLSLERPEILAGETVREEYSETVRQKGRYRKVRRTCLVRVVRVVSEEIEDFVPRGHHEITCPCWGVAGHYRRCKSGRMAWVKPHRKGRERRNPEAYEPKEYVLPKGV